MSSSLLRTVYGSCSLRALLLPFNGRVRPITRSQTMSSAILPFQVTASVTKSRKVRLAKAASFAYIE